MIITCENCNTKFNLNYNLIGDNGRLLQCSKCNHKWFFKSLKKEEQKLAVINDEIIKKKPELEKPFNNTKIVNKKTNKTKIQKDTNIVGNFIIIIISLISLILVLDTFKLLISSFVPGFTNILDSLYQSLNDLHLFIKDLFS